MNYGKTISLFLVNGDPSGLVCAYLSNWTGQSIRIPRNILNEASERTEVNRSGVYFLFGMNEEEIPKIYIGEGENVFKRLKNHIKEKEFWNEAIVFSSKDENLTKGHIKYLESKLINMVSKKSEYILNNEKINEKTNLPEMAIADMESFLKNIKVMLPTLGYNIFNESNKVKKGNVNLFKLNVGGIIAKGFLTTDGFVVNKGSYLSKEIKESLSNGYKRKRERLININKVELVDENLVFKEDTEFRSPSEAASIILGVQVNGRKSWKNNKGQSINDLERNEN